MAAADVIVKSETFLDNEISCGDASLLDNHSKYNIYDGEGNDDHKMHELLREFDLEILYTILKIGDITFRSLKYISENDINEAIRSIAYRAEFREKLFAWRRDKFGFSDLSILPPSNANDTQIYSSDAPTNFSNLNKNTTLLEFTTESNKNQETPYTRSMSTATSEMPAAKIRKISATRTITTPAATITPHSSPSHSMSNPPFKESLMTNLPSESTSQTLTFLQSTSASTDQSMDNVAPYSFQPTTSAQAKALASAATAVDVAAALTPPTATTNIVSKLMANNGPPSTSYKIVKTKEDKNRSLVLVPASWEVDGVLSWPKLRSDEKVNNFIESHVGPEIPGEVEWMTCPAKVVETNILGYDVGNARLSVLRMQNSTSSTTDDEYTVSAKRCRTTKNTVCEKNYSALLLKQMPANTTPTVEHHDNDNISAQSTLSADNSHAIATTPAITIAYSSADNANGTINFESKMRKMRAELGETTKKVNEMHDVLMKGRIVVALVNNKPTMTQLQFEPIDTDADAKMLENLLENNEYEEALIAHFTEDRARCSHLKGNNVAFALVDKVFTRKFFDNVSWTGVAKQSCKKKTCFSQFVRIRKFFFKLCHLVDKNFSIPMCDDWLKNVAMRTSGARMLVKGTRVSRTKNRKSTGRRTIQSKTDVDESENDRFDEQSKVVETIVPDWAPIPEHEDLQSPHAQQSPEFKIKSDSENAENKIDSENEIENEIENDRIVI